MRLSCIIPAYNEEGCIADTVIQLYSALKQNNIEHEIRVINDNSTDKTKEVLGKLKTRVPTLVVVDNNPPNGYGMAVRKGLETFQGDSVCVCMADASDSPEDVIKFFRSNEHYDCVFGSRWTDGAQVIDYPRVKQFINRLANYFISLLFWIKYTDVTNGFKMYRNYVIEELKPFKSRHFDLAVEIPLKAIVRGYSYTVLPNSWTNREIGETKFNIAELGIRYLFTVLACFAEKWCSRGFVRKKKSE